MEPLSALFLTPGEVQARMYFQPSLHFLNGDKDEAWPPENVEFAFQIFKNSTLTLHIIPEVNHFQYFGKEKWPAVKVRIEKIFQEWSMEIVKQSKL